MAKTILSIYKNDKANEVVANLLHYGYTNEEISIVVKKPAHDMHEEDSLGVVLAGGGTIKTRELGEVAISGPLRTFLGIKKYNSGVFEGDISEKFGSMSSIARNYIALIRERSVLIGVAVTNEEEESVKEILLLGSPQRIDLFDKNLFQENLGHYENYHNVGHPMLGVKGGVSSDKYYDEF
ncbi:MAG TPA: hypothetical protein VG917_05405 [Patescibacteria group bacterium]|nr:hypothetical protein [Patescibacteria group bacterium]